MDKIYLCNKILFANEKHEVLIHAITWVNLEEHIVEFHFCERFREKCL